MVRKIKATFEITVDGFFMLKELLFNRFQSLEFEMDTFSCFPDECENELAQISSDLKECRSLLGQLFNITDVIE